MVSLVGASVKLVTPKCLAAFDVDRADEIVRGGGNENQTSCGHSRASIVGRSDPDRKHGGDVEGTVVAADPKA